MNVDLKGVPSVGDSLRDLQASAAAGCLPMLVGLIVVMPVLGHATWHLYRKVMG